MRGRRDEQLERAVPALLASEAPAAVLVAPQIPITAAPSDA